jgi:ribonuclease T1
VPSSRASTSAILANLRRRPLLALVILIVLLVIGYAARGINSGNDSHPTPNNSASTATVQRAGTTALSSLPSEAQHTIALIRTGGPFPYSHDGIVYNNLEKQLPKEDRGYYHEFTVVTPGSDDRGARRIITGKDGQFYYTSNHYKSFVEVDLGR